MVCETFFQRRSLIGRLDPRARIIAALGLCTLIAVSGGPASPAAGLAGGLVFAVLARLPVRPTGRRLVAVNAFVLLLGLVLPLTADGPTAFRVAGLELSRPGLARAGTVALKANGIVLIFTALLSTEEPTRLGRALHRLGLPAKLTQLYFFTVRYVDVLHHEYRRLREAMKIRCFHPGLNLHTYRSLGYLVGMLLVRSFERSERIMHAMKCRGFDGRFHVLEGLAYSRLDAAFGGICGALFAALLALELL